MRPLRPYLTAAPLLAALAGCAPVHWEHPTVGTAYLDADQAYCGQLAQQQAFLYTPAPAFRPLPFRRGTLDGPLYSPLDELMAQQDLRNFCMQSRGYRLVPDS